MKINTNIYFMFFYSECFFAGKGTALVLALKDIPQYSERRLSTDSIRSTNSTQSNNSDIQHHLQSMFYLLRHEETLKMVCFSWFKNDIHLLFLFFSYSYKI